MCLAHKRQTVYPCRLFIPIFNKTSSCLKCLPSCRQLEVVEGGTGDLGRLVRVYSRPEDVGNLASPANFARFQFHTLFPRLHRAIYLDADTVVRGDIAQVWRRLVGSRKLLVAVPRYTHLVVGWLCKDMSYGHIYFATWVGNVRATQAPPPLPPSPPPPGLLQTMAVCSQTG